MTLDANAPTDQVELAELPSYIREVKAALNALLGSGGDIGFTDLSIAAGVTSLSIGTDLTGYGVEVVKVTGTGVATLATILGGTEGNIIIFIFQDSNIDITDGVKSDGKFYLNQLPALSDFTPAQDDILAIVNIGGDGASTYGYWKELFRTISVK